MKWMPPVGNSVDNGPSTILETDIQNQDNSVDNRPITLHETDTKRRQFS